MPVLPSSLSDLANFLDFNMQRYICCQQPFFQDKVTDTHGKCSIIFACSTLIRKIVMLGSNELHADATFKVVPSIPPSRQLFIMHLIYQNHSIPIVYTLMESKTEEAYTLLLSKCKELFPFIKPSNIMTDFESGLLNAFKSVYPDADQHSCFFHYVQALVKNIRTRGLTHFVKSNVNAQFCVQMFCALALLPTNKIDEGYTVIRQYARDKNIFIDMAPFFSYFSRYWLNNQNGGEYLFSVHGIARRTNNNIESFHGRLKEKFQVMHPNLWTFLTHLNELSTKSHITINQLEQGHSVTRPIKIKYIANSQRIRIASSQLDLGILSVNEFLLQCCHTTERYLREELNWQINVLGEVTSENDDNDHDAIAIHQLNNSTITDINVTNDIVHKDAIEDEIFVVDFHNISIYSNDSDQQQQEPLVSQDMDPIDIEYDVEIVAAERDEQQNNEYAHYNSK